MTAKHPLAQTGVGNIQSFRHSAEFTEVEVSGGLGLGPLGSEYEALFAEALEDGIITSEERERLDKAASNLGLDKDRLRRLEQAMMAAYETRHRVQVVEAYQVAHPSLTPVVPAAPESSEASAAVSELKAEVARLTTRVAELEEELRKAQAAINVEVDLGDLESAVEAGSQDPEEQWRRVRRDPTNASALRDLFRIHEARDELDGAWRAAQALSAIGEANEAERALFEQHRTRGLIAPRSGLSADAWQDCLYHPEEEALTGQIFSVIAPAVLLGRVTTLRRDGSLHQPPPDTRHVPAESTIMSVRAIGWAAAILGLPTPIVHLEKELDVGYQHIPGVPPLTVVGSQAVRGKDESQLAFMVGRHLSGYRSEHFVKTLFSAVPDLEDLFLAALVISQPTLPVGPQVRHRVEPLARAIEPLLEAAGLDALRGHFLRFVEEGGRTNLQRWSAAVDKTACRVGLALSQDLASAFDLLAEEEGPQGALALDLLAFSTSSRFHMLRKRLGIALSD